MCTPQSLLCDYSCDGRDQVVAVVAVMVCEEGAAENAESPRSLRYRELEDGIRAHNRSVPRSCLVVLITE